MKSWTKFIVIAVAAIALSATPAFAGHRVRVRQAPVHRHAMEWSHAYDGWTHGYRYVPVYPSRVYVPSYPSLYYDGWHGHRRIHQQGVGIHAGGLGIHISF